MKTEINQINENLSQLYSYHSPHLEIKVTQDTEELHKAKRLRQNYYKSFKPKAFLNQTIEKNKMQQKSQIEKQKAVVYDGYDSFAEHLIIIDHKADKIIAYVRLIDAYTAYKIGGYYSETRFNLGRLFNNQMFYLEMSRIVIDPEYNCNEIAQLLWSGLVNYAQTKGIDSLIGSFTLSLNESNKTLSFIQYLKEKHISSSEYRVTPYQLFPDSNITKKENFNDPLIRYFFDKGCKLCGDAHWNHDFNCVEIFFHCPFNNESVLFNYIDVNIDETDPGVNYIN